jgi:hypothetical protein
MLATSLLAYYLLDSDGAQDNRLTDSLAETQLGLEENASSLLGATDSESGQDTLPGQAPVDAEKASPIEGGGTSLAVEPSSPVVVHLVIPDLGVDTIVTAVGLLPVGVVDQGNFQLQNYYQGLDESVIVDGLPTGPAGDSMVVPGTSYHDLLSDLIDLEDDTQIYVYDLSQIQVNNLNRQMALPTNGEPIEIRLEDAHWVVPTFDNQTMIITCWQCGLDSWNILYVEIPPANQESPES